MADRSAAAPARRGPDRTPAVADADAEATAPPAVAEREQLLPRVTPGPSRSLRVGAGLVVARSVSSVD
ncbi:hypothetical protein STRTUCAR8_00018 [Streptomyces turgidiscabies Car8]|uniref:Uncharacterized protein n=1 Tax=Streptomyces turgidiscabies (strain Car8) TaxID=698760 RepID=L7FEZ1_STRT8|nr:hypothetical protein STRTUCAR8_00018 [Streptomyces turgidiscabies Car8]